MVNNIIFPHYIYLDSDCDFDCNSWVCFLTKSGPKSSSKHPSRKYRKGGHCENLTECTFQCHFTF